MAVTLVLGCRTAKEEAKKPSTCKGSTSPYTTAAVLVLHSGPAYTCKEGKNTFFFFQVEAKAWSSAALQVNSLDTDHFSDEHS